MLKIITLAVVLLTVVLLHSVNGRRQNGDDVMTTGKPRLIRVHLTKSAPSKNVVVDADDVSRTKRDVVGGDLEFFGGHRSPVMKIISPEKTDSEPTEDFFRSDVKGFEGRELEEKLADIGDVVDDPAEATDGRALTDDENQRFDVETTSSKMNRFEEIDAFFDKRHDW